MVYSGVYFSFGISDMYNHSCLVNMVQIFILFCDRQLTTKIIFFTKILSKYWKQVDFVITHSRIKNYFL